MKTVSKKAARSKRQTELAAIQKQREDLEALAASANEELAGMRERRDSAAQNASQNLARVATLEERHRSARAVLGKIDGLVSDMAARGDSLRAQIDASAVEKLQRETENQQMITQLEELEAERNTTEARDGLLAAMMDIDDSTFDRRGVIRLIANYCPASNSQQRGAKMLSNFQKLTRRNLKA